MTTTDHRVPADPATRPASSVPLDVGHVFYQLGARRIVSVWGAASTSISRALILR